MHSLLELTSGFPIMHSHVEEVADDTAAVQYAHKLVPRCLSGPHRICEGPAGVLDPGQLHLQVLEHYPFQGFHQDCCCPTE